MVKNIQLALLLLLLLIGSVAPALASFQYTLDANGSEKSGYLPDTGEAEDFLDAYYAEARVKNYTPDLHNSSLHYPYPSMSVDGWDPANFDTGSSYSASVDLFYNFNSATVARVSLDYSYSILVRWTGDYSNAGVSILLGNTELLNEGLSRYCVGSNEYQGLAISSNYSNVLDVEAGDTLTFKIWGYGESYRPGVYSQAKAQIYNVQISAVPLPGSIWLLGSGLIGIVGVRRKFKK